MASLAVKRSYANRSAWLSFHVTLSTYLMIISKQFIQKIDSLAADKSLIFGINETMPTLLLESTEDIVVLGIQLDLVLVQVVKQVFGTQDLRNFDKLIRVAVAMEEGLFSENHGSEHSTKRPHVEGVIVFLKINKKLRTFEVP